MKETAQEGNIKPGLSPGTLVHVGRRKTGLPRLFLIQYNTHQLTEKEIGQVENLEKPLDQATPNWLNMDGIHDGSLIAQIGEYFDIHPLTCKNYAPPITDFFLKASLLRDSISSGARL